MKHFFKKTLALFALLIVIVGCQKDDNISTDDSSLKQLDIEVNLISKHQYSKNHIINGIVSALPKQNDVQLRGKNSQAKATYVSEYDFYIKDEHAYHIVSGDYESYTFEIVRLEDNGLLENMVVTTKADGSHEAFVMKYDVTETEKQAIIDGVTPTGIEDRTLIEPLPEVSNSDGVIDPVAIGNTGIYHDFATGLCYFFGGVENVGGTLAITWVPTGCTQEVIDFIANSTNPHDGGGSSDDDDEEDDDDFGPDMSTGNNNGTNPSDYSGGNGDTPSTSNNNNDFNNSNTDNTNEEDAVDEIKGFTKPISSNASNSLKDKLAHLVLDQIIIDWIDNSANSEAVTQLNNFLVLNQNDSEAEDFVTELIGLAIAEENQEDVYNLLNLTLLLEQSEDQLFTDAFAIQLFDYIDLNINTFPPDYSYSLISIKVFLNYLRLRDANPSWSRARCLWYASSEIVHLGLDVFGLIPAFGEPADIVNGAIYTIEGDTLNAGLSFASAIPFVGWLSATGKITIKVVNQTSHGLISIVWKTAPDGFITFGSRSTLKHVIGTAGTGQHAHHIIPWAKSNKEIVQKAANSSGAFNMNEALNGIGLDVTSHLTGHSIYSARVDEILDEIITPGMTNDEAYNVLTDFIDYLRNLIEQNPDLNLGQIADLINYP